MSEVEPGAGTSRHVGDAVPGAGTSPYVGDGVPGAGTSPYVGDGVPGAGTSPYVGDGGPRRLDAVPHRVDAVPVEARAFQGQRAGIVTRTAANTVDFVLVVAVLAGGYAAWSAVKFLVNPTQFSFPAPSWLFVLVCFEIVLFVCFTVSWATTGRTFGDHQLGLRVVNFRGERLRWPGAVIRAAFCCILPIGLYWAAVSPTNRSVQDSVLRTSVVYDWTIRRRTTGGSPARGEPSRPPGPA